MWKSFLRWLTRQSVVAAAETVAERSKEGPVTTGNVLKPAAKEAGKTAIREIVKRVIDKPPKKK